MEPYLAFAMQNPVLACLLAYLVLINLWTIWTYGADKFQARRGQHRTSEIGLLTLAMVGGSPGAILSRWVFNHKTHKQPFKTYFWLVILAQVAIVVLSIYFSLDLSQR